MRAVIYTRVSSDPSGGGRSVASQEEECRRVCEVNGWVVGEVLCDNDRGASRWSAGTRTQYDLLSEVLKPGDVLVTWEASRASRDLAAYVDLRNLCAERGIPWCYSGKLHDLRAGDDRFITGLDGLLAEREADVTRDRVLRGKRAAALAGLPAGRPPYGYRRVFDQETGKSTGWAIDATTGPIVREIVERVLDDESLWSIVRDFHRRGVPAPSGQKNAAGAWRPQRVRTMILTPTYAGLRVHQGAVLGKGRWEPIISELEHDRLTGILTDPARRSSHQGPEPRHLLSNIARCGVCNEPVRWFGPKSLKSPRYLCSASSCVGRRADLVDLLVVETLINRLSRPDALAALTTDPGKSDQLEARAELQDLEARLSAFVDQAVDGSISPASMATIESRLLPQIEAARARAVGPLSSPVIRKAAGPDARERWGTFSLLDQRALVASLVTVRINRSSTGTRRFNPDDITIEWVAA